MKKIILPLLVSLFTIMGVNAQIPSYVPTNGLVGYWPFNGNANDESGNGNHGTVNGATLTTDRFGNAGKAYGFDGFNKIEVQHNNSLNIIGDLTLSTWFLSEGPPLYRTNHMLIAKRSNAEFNTFPYALCINYQFSVPNEYKKSMFTTASSPSGYQFLQSTKDVSNNNWNHLAAVVNGNLLTLYLNGIVVLDTLIDNSKRVPNLSNLLFGSGARNDLPAEQLIGSLDDIAIYNRALTPQEITALYTSTAPCQSTSSTTSLSITSFQLPYTWNGLTFTAAGTQTDTLTNAAGCDSLATLNLTVTYNLPSHLPTNGLVGYWPFNGNANDESGNGNNGTVNGATLTTDRFGNVGKAYGFDGVDDFIKCIQAGPTGNPTVTAVLWLKTAQTSYGHLIGYGGNGQSGNDFRVLINQNCQQAIGFDTYDNINALNDNLNDEIWNQYIVVYDGSNGNNVSISKVYKNGTLMTSQCLLINRSNTNIQSALPITFGKYHGIAQSGYFNGSLDDIAIYNRALTQQEITALYQAQLTTNPSDTGTKMPHDTLRVGINVTNPQRNLHVKDVMRLEPRQAPPTNPSKGDMYFDDRLNKLRVFDGTSWQNCW